MIGMKQIEKILCIACTTPIGEHSKNGLARCLFRIQGTMVANVKELDDKWPSVDGITTFSL